MRVNGIEIVGHSVSGYSTSVAIPEYNVAFDCGRATRTTIKCENLALTHGHLDHMADIARHAYLRQMGAMSPSRFITPPWLVSPIHHTFAFWSEVQEAKRAPYETVRAVVGDRVDVGNNRYLYPFMTDHRISSQGYTLIEERKRLRAEFRGRPGPELAQLRNEGVDFSEVFEVPLVVFTGDTRISVLDRNLFETKVLIMECTFLDGDVKDAHDKGHIHLDQIAEREDRLSGVEALVLCHFSQRYTDRDIKIALNRLPSGLREKTSFLPGGGW